ncbi:molybdenum cofactor guanylyltransferase [Salinivibrio sp. ML290]|uniref:molybdenum cofactor guanylyltransferase n=1 Tax=Salinivibrio sp. ML290 TaxID=1909468 RepID=UPI0009884975|nr:molybdenum cofactor guanylyltransferase [Salinivibrio sp. ML290]OOE72285.1 hypothetical protein BZG23_14980 [Salinivibrio sp. ML290]
MINDKEKEIVGVVLAGGLSRRMGEDKALLTHRAQSLIERQAVILRQSICDRVLICADKKEYSDIRDIYSNRGPLGGIYSAMTYFPHAILVFIPIDMPLVTSLTITSLVHEAKRSNESKKISKNNVFPLVMMNRKREKEIIGEVIKENRDLSVNRACEKLAVSSGDLYIQSHELHNCNTPGDWLYAKHLLESVNG